VKEISWCSPKSSIEQKKEKWSNDASECSSCNNSPTAKNKKASKFGIIAAMDESRIIGIDGKLPWSLAEDREYFKNVTRGGKIIIGKNTFYEDSDSFSHLNHLQRVIVVSTSMDEEQIGQSGLQNVQLARSFEDALVLSEALLPPAPSEQVKSRAQEDEENEIDCWIGGGQLLYEQAIRHPDAFELRLTTVHTKNDVDVGSGARQVSFFPAKYRWDNTFKEVPHLRRQSKEESTGVSYTFSVYRRRRKPS